MKTKKAQEEMVGFVLIMIIVAVILVVFLGFYLSTSKKETVESYEAESFMQSSLQFTTDCESDLGKLSLQKLIFECYDRNTCLDGRDSCEVLEIILKDILKESWKTGEGGETPIKGYEFKIASEVSEEGEERELEYIKEGETLGNSKGSYQSLSKGANSIDIFFTVYYS